MCTQDMVSRMWHLIMVGSETVAEHNGDKYT